MSGCTVGVTAEREKDTFAWWHGVVLVQVPQGRGFVVTRRLTARVYPSRFAAVEAARRLDAFISYGGGS